MKVQTYMKEKTKYLKDLTIYLIYNSMQSRGPTGNMAWVKVTVTK